MYQGSFFDLPSGVTVAAVAVLDGTGAQLTGFDSSRPANATQTAVPIAVPSQVLLAANLARRQWMVHNPTNKAINIAFAATATLAAYAIQVPNGGAYESPIGGYTGVLSVIWLSAPSAGPSLHVTEVTT